MKLSTKTVTLFTIALIALSSCQDSATEDIALLEAQLELSKEDVLSAVETITFNYPITAFEDSSESIELYDDFDLEDYARSTSQPKISFPIVIIINEATKTIASTQELKQRISENRGRRKPHFVYPFSVVLDDGSELEITDKEAFKDYLNSLDEGGHPTFVFPLSVIKNGETITVDTIEELNDLLRRHRGRRPHLIFPLSVVLEDGSELVVSDLDAFKAYLKTLDEGVHPAFVFPISIVKKGKIITINSQEELDALIKKPRRGRRPSFVFPISVVLDSGSQLEITDKEALKAYIETLLTNTHPVFVYPLSIIKKGETITINNQEELFAAFGW